MPAVHPLPFLPAHFFFIGGGLVLGSGSPDLSTFCAGVSLQEAVGEAHLRTS